MTKVLVAIANGSEEMEAVITIDMLRRANIDVTVASVELTKQITASRGVEIVAETMIGECENTEWDAIVLPGGMPGAKTLAENAILMNLVKAQAEANKWVAAICAAPAVALSQHGLLNNVKATCYPAFADELKKNGGDVQQQSVVIAPPFITSQGPGTAFDFALSLIKNLVGEKVHNDVKAAALL